MLYSRPQLQLLVVLAAVLLVGLGVREWRAGFPDLAERLERFDREDAAAVALSEPGWPPTAPAASGTAGRGPAPALQWPGPRTAHAGPPGTGERADEPRAPRGRSAPAEAAPGDPRPLDINRAAAADFARLPGVGPGLADRIVAERERRGRFESPEALRYVLGMGPKKLAAIRALVAAGDPVARDAPPPTSADAAPDSPPRPPPLGADAAPDDPRPLRD
jgi:competence ComEA-like helix-hairpin-helix protein